MSKERLHLLLWFAFLLLAICCLIRIRDDKNHGEPTLAILASSEGSSPTNEKALFAQSNPIRGVVGTPQITAQASTPAREIICSAWRTAQPEMKAFAHWTDRFLEATEAQRGELMSEGMELAKQRRAVLTQLIRSDPEQALAATVPLAVRIQLPDEIVSALEQRVSGRGDLSLVGVAPVPGQHVSEPIFRTALVNGNEYRAFTYGRRTRLATLPDASIIGIALDRALAVSDSPLRVLESGETASGRQVQEVCVISGKVTPVSTDAPLNVAEPTAVEVNGQVQVLCETAHVVSYEDRLLGKESVNMVTAADGQPGSGGVSGRPLQAWTHGIKKVLIIRVDFSDLPGTPVNSDNQPITEDFAVNLINSANGVRDYYQQGSYGKSSLQIAPTTGGNSPDVTGVLRMPRTAVSYSTNGDNGSLHVDARMAAQVLGFAVDTYDRIGVVFSYLGNIPGSLIDYGGLGEVIGKNFWINGYYNLRVVTHEIGHNYGLWHANLWFVSDGNPVSDTGTNIEYGDTFDIMGSGGEIENHFSHWNKSILQWIPDTAIPVVTNSGTYRIYRFDHQNANLSNTLAIKIVRDGARDYWIGYRRATDNANLDNGAYVLWGYNNNQGGHLLDMTTPGMGSYDEALGIGAIFTDPVTNITIRPIATGGVSPNEFLDVQVFFGTPPVLPPIIAVQPESRLAYAGESTTFAVTAFGPPPLSYRWQFNDSLIVGATEPTYQLTNVQSGNVGNYTVVVTNAGGAVTSSVATLAIIPSVPLQEALDTVGLNWTWQTGGAAVWDGRTNTTHDNLDAAQSGFVTEGQESWIQTVVTNGSGGLSFWWKVSSEKGFGFFEFYVDGTIHSRISGEVEWRQETLSLASGNHVLRWRYVKYAGGIGGIGGDQAWLDQVSFNARPLSLSVTSLSSFGEGSLSQAIADANALRGGNISLSNLTGTILLASSLPEIKGSVNILGPGPDNLAISGNDLCRVLSIASNAICLVSGVTIRDGAPQCTDDYTSGGGIYNAGNLTLIDCWITTNRTLFCTALESGGGIYSVGSLVLSNVVVADNFAVRFGGGVFCSGIATISHSRITRNHCLNNVGGLAFDGQTLEIGDSTISHNGAGAIGGIFINGGTAVIRNSTICSNYSGNFEGGGGLHNSGNLMLTNCTVSGNSVLYGGGGGIKNVGTLVCMNCTIAFNREDSTSIGGGVHNIGTCYARNTIFANNAVLGPPGIDAAPDFGGVLNSQGYNLIANSTNATIIGETAGNVYGADPHLSPLQDNGGSAWTHALLFPSPGIGGGTLIGAPAYDQRGIKRPQGAAIDIGAYEFVSRPFLTGRALNNQSFQLALNGEPGLSYAVQTSSNLIDWLPLSTNTITTGGMLLITDSSMTNQPRRFYRAEWLSSEDILLPATSGTISPPFIATNGYVFQPSETSLANSGRAAYTFNTPNSGTYVIRAMIGAANDSANSIFINIDAEPQDPGMISDIPITSGFEQRTLSWRGNGTFNSNQFVPKVFNLQSGPHQLIVRGREGNTLMQSFSVVATNFAPTVSVISQSPIDVDTNAAGVQAFAGTTVQYSASVSDPNGLPLSWQWVYSVNGGSEITYQSGNGAVPGVNFTYNSGTVGSTYLWILRVSNNQVTSQSQLAVGVHPAVVPPQGLIIPASLGIISGPYIATNGYVYQLTETGVANGGRASYFFSVTNVANYVIQVLVDAPNGGANSVFLDIDTEPASDFQASDILPFTSGFEPRTLNWRGNGTFDNNQFVPKIFALNPGPHQLIIRGREANTRLQTITILPYP